MPEPKPQSEYLRALFTLVNNKEEMSAWHAFIAVGCFSTIFHVELLWPHPVNKALTADPAQGVHWVSREYNRFNWIELPLPWITKKAMQQMKKQADKLVAMKAKYDIWGAILGQFLPVGQENAFFCSELAVHLLAPYTPKLNVTKWYSPVKLWEELYEIVKTKYPAFVRLK